MAAVPLLLRAGEGDLSGPRPAAEVSTFCSCAAAILSRRKRCVLVGPCSQRSLRAPRSGNVEMGAVPASLHPVGASQPRPRPARGACVGYGTQWQWGHREQGVEALLCALHLSSGQLCQAGPLCVSSPSCPRMQPQHGEAEDRVVSHMLTGTLRIG